LSYGRIECNLKSFSVLSNHIKKYLKQ